MSSGIISWGVRH